MTDDELIDYFEIHSKTERALFSGNQINRLLRLAGEGGEKLFSENKFYSIYYTETLKRILNSAREPGRNLRNILI